MSTQCKTKLQEQGIEDVYIEQLKEIYSLHQQLDDSRPTQRKQQDQHQERSTPGREHIAQAVYSSTRKYITTADLGNQKLEGRR